MPVVARVATDAGVVCRTIGTDMPEGRKLGRIFCSPVRKRPWMVAGPCSVVVRYFARDDDADRSGFALAELDALFKVDAFGLALESRVQELYALLVHGKVA